MRRVDIKETGCWEWNMYRDAGGYGRMMSRDPLTHRAAWRLFVGVIPPRACVLHRCDNPPCCNPSHLFLGTRADNNADKASKGRHVSLRGECHANAKLSLGEVMEIRRLYVRNGGDRSAVALGRRFGVTASLICQIASGKAWRHVA